MNSKFFVTGTVILLFAVTLMTGCDLIYGGKKATKAALEDLKALQGISKVGVGEKDYTVAFEKARISSGNALGKLSDGDLKTALQETIDNYADAKKVLETPGQINSAIPPFNGYIAKYAFKAPSQYVLQFGLLQKIFDKAGKNIARVEELLK